MNMLTFNVDDGYLEGVLRGFRSGFLTSSDFVSLTQCETLEDVRMHLSSTDYSTFLQNEPAPLSTKTIAEHATRKLVDEFRFIRSQAVEPLSTFLDYLTYPYMIDNVILLITGTLHGRDISELIDKCHPLGMFDTMASLCIASTPEELYREIIVDTPLAPYFAECVSLEDLTDMNIEIIRNTLYKAYLADFHRLCTRTGGATAELMGELLSFEADRRAINITLNSFGTELTRDEREKLLPLNGALYPEGIFRLSRAEDTQAVASAIEPYALYRGLFQSAADSPDKSLEDAFFEHEVRLCKQTFEMQFHYAIFYAYLRLKEQEVRNILWISECIAQKQKRRINNYVASAFA
jgi:V-type H+-transporting ATPase subunit d